MQVELLKILARARTTALFVTHQISEAVFLSNRVVVLSARPARVKEIIADELPPARTLAMPVGCKSIPGKQSNPRLGCR